MSVKPPQFLVDLYRDLRDRRLLIPAGALLLALVAVPVLLSRPASPKAPPPEPGSLSSEGAATQPAVLAEEVTVRDYEKRLAGSRRKNPFAEQFTPPESDGRQGRAAAVVAPATGSTGAAVATGGTSPGTGGAAGPSPGPISPPPARTPDPPKPPRAETRYFTWRIDVTVGPNGAAEERDGVRQLSLLPSPSRPVAVFLGVEEDGKRAVFAVSGDVSNVEGSGRCSPSSSDCSYLVLREGEHAVLDYDVDGERYKLALRNINRVQIDEPGTVAGKF